MGAGRALHCSSSVRDRKRGYGGAVQHSGDGARSPIVKSPIVVSNTPFIAAYTINRERIVILGIYHGAQQWAETL
jgi:hypothetical protein